MCLKVIGDAEFERLFRTDNGQVNMFFFGKGNESVNVSWFDGNVFGDCPKFASAAVARGKVDFLNTIVFENRPGKCLFFIAVA